MMSKRGDEHSFSIEMKSKRWVKRISFLDEGAGDVFFEGFLGPLKNLAMVEGVMLEIEGKNGVLKLDITQLEVEKCLEQNKTHKRGERQ
jgi:hypothetical protein